MRAHKFLLPWLGALIIVAIPLLGARPADALETTNVVKELHSDHSGEASTVTIVCKDPVVYRVLNWQEGGVEVDLYDVLLGEFEGQTVKIGDGLIDKIQASSEAGPQRNMARLLIRTTAPVTSDIQRDGDTLVLTLSAGKAPASAGGAPAAGSPTATKDNIDEIIRREPACEVDAGRVTRE